MNRRLIVLALALLVNSQGHAAARTLGHASSRPRSIALVASEFYTENWHSLAAVLGLGPGIYLFQDGRPPRKVRSAGNTLFEHADLAPGLELLSYRFTDPDPDKIRIDPRRRRVGIAVIDTHGRDLVRIPNGVSSAWSPSGDRLAILVSHLWADAQTPDTVVIWNRGTGVLARFAIESRQFTIAWVSPDTVQAGAFAVVPDRGTIMPSIHAAPFVSPDRKFSMSSSPDGSGVFADTEGYEATCGVFQVCGIDGGHHAAAWVPWRGSGSVIAVATEFKPKNAANPYLYANATSFIDVSIPELIETVPGKFIGMCADGKTPVLLHEDGLQFLAVDRGHAPSAAHGSALMMRRSARLEMRTVAWSSPKGDETLGSVSINVRAGDHLGTKASRIYQHRPDSTAFRVIAVRPNGSVLMDCRSDLTPSNVHWRVPMRRRFIVTHAPISVGTLTVDAGESFQFRVVGSP